MPPDNIDVIEHEGWHLIELSRQAPDAVVPQYPTWTLLDLTMHVAGIHGRTGLICETLASERVPAPEPPADADPFDWAAEQLSRMLEGLSTADPDAAVWTFVDDPALSFWIRRMVIETGVHRWDAQSAVEDPSPLLPAVSGHGLDEFAGMYLPKLSDVQTLEVAATDVGHTWRFGPGEPTARVAGKASDLFLRLMSRPGVELPADWALAVDSLGSPADR
jgi:uncharacterized protein (TIGR03083 family)